MGEKTHIKISDAKVAEVMNILYKYRYADSCFNAVASPISEETEDQRTHDNYTCVGHSTDGWRIVTKNK